MTCRCGHPRGAHEHYRPGTDCGACDCPRWRPRWRLRRAPAMSPEQERRFYEDPKHLEPAGPWHGALLRPGIRSLRYDPSSCGPQTQTLNIGSQRYWAHNPDVPR